MATLNDIIQKTITGDHAFVFYRFPGETECQVMLHERSTEYKVPKGWKNKTGYMIHGFSPGFESLWINADVYSVFTMNDMERFVPEHEVLNNKKLKSSAKCYGQSTERKEYEALFNNTRTFFINGGEKVVISRCKTIKADLGLRDLFTAFIKAHKRYKNAYLSLAYIPGEGYWFGASPEVFLEKRDGAFMIDALAGTLPNTNNVKPKWRAKELDEQNYVVEYVKRVLKDLDITDFKYEKPESINAGPVWHLRTRFQINDVPDIEKLMTVLHPTPAVCGTPRIKAYDFINKNEGHQRGWYSGYWGPVNFNKAKDLRLYVNLRCLHADSECLTLFAGGGITSASKLEEEWAETDFKMTTLLDVLAL